jgi:hypothetical protein
VVLVLPAGITDARKVTAAEARVFAVVMPNKQGLSNDWREFAVPVSEVEKLAGCTFFGSLSRDVARDLRMRKPETRAKASGELAAWEKGCVIANRETKKYHLPGGRYYEKAKTSKHAVFFKTEADAKKAGYTAAAR